MAADKTSATSDKYSHNQFPAASFQRPASNN
jgi:hypothetical protein